MLCRKCSKDNPEASLFCAWCGTQQIEKPRKKRTHGNGLGTVYWTGTSWRAEHTIKRSAKMVDGKPVIDRTYERKDGFKSKKEAQQYLNKILLSGKEKVINTIADLYATFSSAAMLKLSDSKQGAYKIAYGRLSAIEDKQINALGIRDLQALIEGRTYYPAKDIRDLLSHLYKMAMAEEQVQNNLTRFMEMPLLEAKETTPWEAEEITKLWNAWKVGDRIAAVSLLMIYSGMMPGELFKLEESMIDWEKNTIIGCGMKTKKRKEQPIIFPRFIEPVLRDLCATSSSRQGRVLGMNKDRFYDEFKILKERLGIREEVRPYSGRHSTSTSLAMKGVPVAAIVEIMRQKDYSTTLAHYNQLNITKLVDELDKLGEGVVGES